MYKVGILIFILHFSFSYLNICDRTQTHTHAKHSSHYQTIKYQFLHFAQSLALIEKSIALLCMAIVFGGQDV